MSYSAVPLDIGQHRDSLFTLWATNTYDPKANPGAMDRFSWLYEGPDDKSRTWIGVETTRNCVVGACSVFRSDRRVRGRSLKAGVINLFMIDSKHRTGAAALAIQRALTGGCHEAGFDLVVIKLSEHRVPVFIRAGYRRVGVVRKWIKWLNAENITDGESRLPSCRHEVVSTADSRFTRLWESAMDLGCIVAEKTAEYLNWRYSGFRDNYRYHCLVRKDDEQLLGYVVYHRMNEGTIVADILCEHTAGPIVDELLRGFADALRREGCAWISLAYLGHPSFENRLRSAGFEVRKSKKDRPLLAYASASLPSEILSGLFDSSEWFFIGDQTTLLLATSVWKGSELAASRG